MKKSLGRGLETLIPVDFDSAILAEEGERIQMLNVSEVIPNPDQPRKYLDPESLQELASSIKKYGILQPLIVSPAPSSNNYIIVAGERRWRASQIAGNTKVPAIIRAREALEQLEVALIENVQRVDLTPLEQALSIEKLHQQFNMSYQTIAERLGKAQSTIHNISRLLNLPGPAKTALAEGKITEGHARAILALKGNEQNQSELLELIIKRAWTVRQAEQYVGSKKRGSTINKAINATSVETSATKNLGKILNTKITLKRVAKGGRLEIHYKNDEELDKLLRRLNTI